MNRRPMAASIVTASLGFSAVAFLPGVSNAGGDRVAKAAKFQPNARKRHPEAKDPSMAFLADCLSDRGARYDEALGQLWTMSDSPDDQKAMMACYDDLGDDIPTRKH